jgi:hypothetical protein
MANLPSGPKGSVYGKFTGSLEKNNYKQGREGAGTMKKAGPMAGRVQGTSSNSGGITQGTRGHKGV